MYLAVSLGFLEITSPTGPTTGPRYGHMCENMLSYYMTKSLGILK